MKKYTLYVEGFNFGSFDNLFEAITAGGSQRVYFDIIDNITNNNAVIDWEEYHVWKKGNWDAKEFRLDELLENRRRRV